MELRDGVIDDGLPDAEGSSMELKARGSLEEEDDDDDDEIDEELLVFD